MLGHSGIDPRFGAFLAGGDAPYVAYADEFRWRSSVAGDRAPIDGVGRLCSRALSGGAGGFVVEDPFLGCRGVQPLRPNTFRRVDDYIFDTQSPQRHGVAGRRQREYGPEISDNDLGDRVGVDAVLFVVYLLELQGFRRVDQSEERQGRRHIHRLLHSGLRRVDLSVEIVLAGGPRTI